MPTILTSNHHVILVDDAVSPELLGTDWCLRSPRGGSQFVVATSGRLKKLKLHRLVAEAKTGDYVVFRDGNPLNCQRTNLMVGRAGIQRRFATVSGQRRGKPTGSRYRGVTRRSVSVNAWHAQIRVNGRLIHLGNWATEEMAASKYDSAALFYFGPDARINSVHGPLITSSQFVCDLAKGRMDESDFVYSAPPGPKPLDVTEDLKYLRKHKVEAPPRPNFRRSNAMWRWRLKVRKLADNLCEKLIRLEEQSEQRWLKMIESVDPFQYGGKPSIVRRFRQPQAA